MINKDRDIEYLRQAIAENAKKIGDVQQLLDRGTGENLSPKELVEWSNCIAAQAICYEAMALALTSAAERIKGRLQ